MKKKNIIIGSLIAASAFCITLNTSCKKAIELNQPGFITADSAIQTEADLNALINSGYFALAADDYYGGNIQIFNELAADHLNGTALDGDYLAIYGRNTNIFNSTINTFYAQASKPVLQANTVLAHIGVASAANTNTITGQAKFIRAISMFDLVRMYAQPYNASTASLPGIPVRTSPDRQAVPRKTIGESYAQIIADLKDAEAKLPSTNGVYATKWSAKALLAKVYFQMNDFTNAYIYANDVIANGGFAFDVSLFKRYSPNGTTETVFGLVYEANNVQGRFQRLHGFFNTASGSVPTGRLNASFYTLATSNAIDTRRTWYKTTNNFFLLGKFDSASFKLPVIHLTELKMIRAESAAETNTNLTVGIGDMNDIINRAYGPASTFGLPAGTTAATLKTVARRERELELVGEGNRLQELKRQGAKGENVSIRGAVYNCPGMIFPFPTNEINYNGFAQNPIGGCN
jgi:hypothetical protein